MLKELPTELLHRGQVLPIINDTRCSKTCAGFESDFKPNTLVPLESPLPMDSVAGTLYATHTGIIEYEVLNDVGRITTIKTQALFVSGFHCHLLSPQDLFGELWEQGGKGSLIIQYSQCIFKLPTRANNHPL